VRIAYVVSRFPQVTETFILRELNAVAGQPGIEAELLSLFPPLDPTVHPAARPWLDRAHRPTLGEALWALMRSMLARPMRTLSSIALIVAGYARAPRKLVRALVTIPLAAAHAAHLRRIGVVHVHAHYATYPALAAWWCWRLAGIPYSITPHAHDIFVDQSFLGRKISEARFVIAISEYNRRFLAPFGAGRSAPIHLVRYGIEPSAYPFRARELHANGPVRTLCVASLQTYKGHAVLFTALARGGGRLRRIELDLVGSGELRQELERLAERLGLAARIRFLGARTENQVIEHLDQADLFVLPSIVDSEGSMEGLPNVLIEALACGLPVVTTRLSGIPELVIDGVTGALARPGDPDALAAALKRVLDDPGAARRWAEAGRVKVEREFDIKDSSARLAGLFMAAGSLDSRPHGDPTKQAAD
jgi:colanic acid/amylovoran biosynthesis glycosyltransferase